MVLLADGPVCGCGKRGCAEALASRTAIERDIWAGVKAGRESLIPEIMKREKRVQIPSGALAEAYRGPGDPLVTEVLCHAVQFYLGLLVATSAFNLIDPEAVILGGGVVEALGEEFLEPIRRCRLSVLHEQAGRRQRGLIVQAKLGDHAALLGAAMFARQKVAAEVGQVANLSDCPVEFCRQGGQVANLSYCPEQRCCRQRVDKSGQSPLLDEDLYPFVVLFIVDFDDPTRVPHSSRPPEWPGNPCRPCRARSGRPSSARRPPGPRGC